MRRFVIAFVRSLENFSLSNMALVYEGLQSWHRSNMTFRNEIPNQIIALQRGIQNEVVTAVQSPFSSDTTNISWERTLQIFRENEKFRIVEDVDAHIR